MKKIKYISRSSPKSSSSQPKQTTMNYQENPEINIIRHELLLRIPGCVVNLMEEGETIELARGDFSLLLISDQNISLATIVKVGNNLQWPLTKDEPVVKLDALHYLFTLPIQEGNPLNYGVTFSKSCDQDLLGSLDLFLEEHSCFSCMSKLKGKNDLDWKDFAPKIEAYNGILAKAIAGGTGQIVKGIFMCSNAYTNQVQNGGESILTRAAEENKNKNNGNITFAQSKSNMGARTNSINQSIKRVRKVSNMTEKMSKTMLNGVGIATGSVVGPLVRSKRARVLSSSFRNCILQWVTYLLDT